MLRTTIANLNPSLWTSAYNVSGNAIGVQSARWIRKPRKPIHLGTAKSKMFRVHPRVKEDPDERAELMRLNTNYKTYMRSLMRYFSEEVVIRESSSDTRITPEEEQAEWERCQKVNAVWNSKIGALREQRHAKEREERHKQILAEVEERSALNAERFEFAENMVRHEKDQSQTFILPDQIDVAIEEALANPTDFNYAIDLDKNIYYGRRTAKKPDQLPGGDNNNDGNGQLKLESAC